jgi:hypothetical protein
MFHEAVKICRRPGKARCRRLPQSGRDRVREFAPTALSPYTRRVVWRIPRRNIGNSRQIARNCRCCDRCDCCEYKKHGVDILIYRKAQAVRQRAGAAIAVARRVAFASVPAAVICPLQEGPALTRSAPHVARLAVAFDLRNVAAHCLPAANLTALTSFDFKRPHHLTTVGS